MVSVWFFNLKSEIKNLQFLERRVGNLKRGAFPQKKFFLSCGIEVSDSGKARSIYRIFGEWRRGGVVAPERTAFNPQKQYAAEQSYQN